ncbi:MAG: VWA domain-containing protein [Kofleriaceae bacterium]
MRKTLFAVLLGTTVFACAKKGGSDREATVGEASPARVNSELREGHGAKPADPGDRAGAAGSAAAPSADGYKLDDSRAVAPAPPPAQGNVKAGEWDDNANYREYVKWLQETPRNIARLDVRDRQFIVVKDKDGKPVPNCAITVTSGQKSASLVTMASGRALVFPHALGFDGDTLSATANCGQSQVTAKLNAKLDGVAELVLATSRSLPARRTIDLAFVLDTTGSMGEEIEAVKSTVRTVADKLANDQTNVRIGLVEYKDRGDDNVTRVFPFSSDLNAFSKSVNGIIASGGGDMPEDMHAGLSTALDKLEWRGDAVARLVVVIADAPPHLDYQDQKDYADAAKRASARGIKLFTVSASGMDTTGQIVMRQMAAFTGAQNLFVLRGGAGPQSVGGGDPKSSCGGTQGQYASGNLDQLILNKVRGELKSLEADPMRIAGIDKDENAKPCNERLVMAN